jgi:hypothetical protein
MEVFDHGICRIEFSEWRRYWVLPCFSYKTSSKILDEKVGECINNSVLWQL